MKQFIEYYGYAIVMLIVLLGSIGLALGLLSGGQQ